MPLTLYNSLTKRKEEFVPAEKGRVGIYACGVTVYDLCHIGHARAAVVFDVLVRYLRSKGLDVTYVRNFTDVDDKIIAKAAQEGTDWKTIAERYIKEFYVDMVPLGLERPTIEPKATDHIAEMQDLIGRLMSKGLAYASAGSVYFSVGNFPAYGRLSGVNLTEAQTGEPGEGKRSPLDFALWKGSKPGEPTWESPWGPGRPGWHIECSAMAMKYLGETLDIHGGGLDLLFPHHENEKAQSEGATGKPFARFWVHNGFVQINREKMSKSLGNIFTLREALKRWHPEAIRYFLLAGHYRSPLDFSSDDIKSCFGGLIRAYAALTNLEYDGSSSEGRELSLPQIKDVELKKDVDPLLNLSDNIDKALSDDLNTPVAISHLFNAISVVYKYGGKQTRDKLVKEILNYGTGQIIQASKILGILCMLPEEFLRWRRDEWFKNLGMGPEEKNKLDIEIKKRITQREKARENKEWEKSDAIRRNLLYDGVYLEDTPKGTKKRIKGEIDLHSTELLEKLQEDGHIEARFYSKRVIPDMLFIHKTGTRKLLIPMGSTDGIKERIDEMEDIFSESNVREDRIYLIMVKVEDRNELMKLKKYSVLECWTQSDLDNVVNSILSR